MTSLRVHVDHLQKQGPVVVIGGHYSWPGGPSASAVVSVRDLSQAMTQFSQERVAQYIFLDDIAASSMCSSTGCSVGASATRVRGAPSPMVQSWLVDNLAKVERMARGRDPEWVKVARDLTAQLAAMREKDPQPWPGPVEGLLEPEIDGDDLSAWLARVEMLAYITDRRLFRPLLLAHEVDIPLPSVLFERSMLNGASRMLHKIANSPGVDMTVAKGEDGQTDYTVRARDGRTIQLRHEIEEDGTLRGSNKCSAILAQLFYHCCKTARGLGSQAEQLSIFYIIPCHDRSRLQDGCWAFGRLYGLTKRWFGCREVTVTAAFYSDPMRRELLCEEYRLADKEEPRQRIFRLQARDHVVIAPASSRPIYVDNNATTRVDPEVLEAMLPYLNDACGNPSSGHPLGWAAEVAVAEAREQVAELIGALPEEIFFTSGATESNNWLLRCLDCGSKATIVTSELEHKSVLEVVAMLGAEGHSVVKVPVTAEGEIEYAALEQLPLGPGSLVSLMAVNNEVHSILDIERVGDLCAARKAIFHSDAAQAVGHIPVDVRRMKIGAMSMSGHKIHSPKGIGALFVARELQPRLRPLILGGGQQENMRSGTVPAPLIVAMGRACALARKNMTAENQMLVGCTQRFLETLDANGIGYRMVGPSDLARRRAGCLCLSISGLDSSRMCEWIPGFVMSQASACNSRGVHSHVLRALSMDTEAAKNTFRIAFGRFNSASDAEELARAIVRAAKERSRMSQENSGGFEIGKPSDTQPSGVSCGLQT